MRRTAATMKTQLALLRYVRPHWRGLCTVLVTMLLSVGMDVLRPWPTKLLIDQVLGHRPMPPRLATLVATLPGPHGNDRLLMWVCLSTVLTYLLGTLMSMASHWATTGFGQRMTFELGADLFMHLQRLSVLYHTRRSVGDLCSRVMGDSYCVQTLLADILLPGLQALVMLATMFWIMLRLDPTMTLVSLGVVPFLLLSIRIFKGPMKRYNRARRDLEGRMTSIVQQTLSAIPTVQAFTREEEEYARFRRCADETVEAYQRSTIAQMLYKLFLGLATASGTAAIMWLGAHYVLQGRITVGTILVFLSYLGSLYGPLNSLAYVASTLQSTAANADRVMEIMTVPPDVADRAGVSAAALRGHVQYEDVTFGYERGCPVLKNISFEARPGEVVAIVGPTGAGKTTLVNLLIRFFDPWSGTVRIDGHDLRDLMLRSLRQQVAVVLQEPCLFPISIAENIGYGRPAATSDEIEQAAAAANAAAFILTLPEAYRAVLGERGATLSGGEKQRLTIARAFLKNAPILILDEPTSALDARTEAMLLVALERLMKRRMTFIIAHRLSTIRNADRILVVDQGQIVEQGRHGELMAADGLYASLYRQQMELAQHGPAPAALTLSPQ